MIKKLFAITLVVVLVSGLELAFAQEEEENLRGSAASGVNESFGGTATAMRGILDGIFGIEQAFVDFFAFLKGTFLGDWGE